MPEEKVSQHHTSYCCLDLDHKGYCKAADAGPRQYVQVERSLLEGILNFMNRRFDGDRLLKHQAHFIGELHRVLDPPPVPQEAAPRLPSGLSKGAGYKTLGAFPVPCATNSSEEATATDWAMRVAREIKSMLVRWIDYEDTQYVDPVPIAALIRQAGSERERRLTSVLFVIMSDMPKKRDWLDPDIEREASRLLGGEL